MWICLVDFMYILILYFVGYSFRKEEDVVGEIKIECEIKVWLSWIFFWRLSIFEIKCFEYFVLLVSLSWLLFLWCELLFIIKMNFFKKGSG